VTKDKPQPAAGKPEKFVWKVTINAPIETVWNTLVKTDEVLPFFFGAVCETKNGLKPGQKMRMVSKDRKHAIVYGEVKEFTPPTRYSHTMMFTQVEGEEPAFTTYDLKDLGSNVTEVTITTLVDPGTKHGKMVASGGYITENLKLIVETGKPNLMGAMIMAMSPLMGFMTPKICRIERWPL
jgi:uncharacterized protein YndB with AHSA1/START domain